MIGRVLDRGRPRLLDAEAARDRDEAMEPSFHPLQVGPIDRCVPAPGPRRDWTSPRGAHLPPVASRCRRRCRTPSRWFGWRSGLGSVTTTWCRAYPTHAWAPAAAATSAHRRSARHQHATVAIVPRDGVHPGRRCAVHHTGAVCAALRTRCAHAGRCPLAASPGSRRARCAADRPSRPSRRRWRPVPRWRQGGTERDGTSSRSIHRTSRPVVAASPPVRGPPARRPRSTAMSTYPLPTKPESVPYRSRLAPVEVDDREPSRTVSGRATLRPHHAGRPTRRAATGDVALEHHDAFQPRLRGEDRRPAADGPGAHDHQIGGSPRPLGPIPSSRSNARRSATVARDHASGAPTEADPRDVSPIEEVGVVLMLSLLASAVYAILSLLEAPVEGVVVASANQSTQLPRQVAGGRLRVGAGVPGAAPGATVGRGCPGRSAWRGTGRGATSRRARPVRGRGMAGLGVYLGRWSSASTGS